MTAPLPVLHTVEEVAAALGGQTTPHYVKEKCRLREWPHRRLARGAVGFTDQDYAEVLELCRAEVAESAPQRWSLAPRSVRRSA